MPGPGVFSEHGFYLMFCAEQDITALHSSHIF